MDEILRENERIDDLERNGYRIIQNSRRFCFGMDAVLLSGFAAEGEAGKSGIRIADLGTGTGIIPLLLHGKLKPAITEGPSGFMVYAPEDNDRTAGSAGPSLESIDLSAGSAGSSLESIDLAAGSAGSSLENIDLAAGSVGSSLESIDLAAGSAGSSLESIDLVAGSAGSSLETFVRTVGSGEASRWDQFPIIGLEIQEEMVDMAERSVRLNHLEREIGIVLGDIRHASDLLGRGRFEVVTSNPPYMKQGGGLSNPDSSKAISRHEILCTFDDVAAQAAALLKPGGRFYLVHRPERLAELIETLRRNRLEPKRLRMVHSFANSEATMVLIESAKGGGTFLKVEKPLIIYQEQDVYTDEILQIYYY